MAITTLDGLLAATRQTIPIIKTQSRTVSATVVLYSLFDLVGSTGTGVLPGTSNTAGVVPTDTTTGCPQIDAFGSGATGYISQVSFGNTVAGRLRLFDMLFKAGTYGFATGTTNLSAQPSFASRVPAGVTTYQQIWIEVTTAFATGTNWSVQVGYTNQAGVSGRLTTVSTVTAASALGLSRMLQLALQSGDTGVQKIDSVIVTNNATAMTAGAFNVLVLQPLWTGRVRLANDGDTHDFAKTGMPIVFADSAIIMAFQPDAATTSFPEVEIIISNA